jgi:opacity protein-like surface antigen
MVSLTLRLRATLLTAIVGALLSDAAQAADMPFFSPAPEPVNDAPVEWGAGWYLRGDIGAARSSLTAFNGVVLTSDMPNNWTIGIGGGYQYNNWFRTDVTVDYEQLFSQKGPNFHFAPCPTAPLTFCSSVSNSKAETIAILSNAYIDLGNWAGFTPYIGGGLGINILPEQTNLSWVDLTGATVSSYVQVDKTWLRFAFAAMAGFAYDVTDHVKLDVGYRWINFGNFTGIDAFNNLISRNVSAHQARVGLRYMID